MGEQPEFDVRVGISSVPVSIDFIIVVAVEVELNAVLDELKPPTSAEKVLKVFEESSVYYIGQLGLYHCAVVMCQMGASGRDSSILVTSDAIASWKPVGGVIMPGIAFGRDKPRGRARPKQVLGDVLVATQIIAYEPERVGVKEIVARGAHPEASLLFVTRLRNLDWKWKPEKGGERGLIFGPLLSGEKLIDEPSIKNRLLDEFPKAIGGEMEGIGVYAASSRSNTNWIVFKAICDWGDGSKTKDYQSLAAKNAASVLVALLSEPGLVQRSYPRTQPAESVGASKTDVVSGSVPTTKLSPIEIQAIVEAALAAGLGEGERRRLLLQALPPNLVGALPTLCRPRDQLQSDLETLNEMRIGSDRPPIALWLDRAAYLAEPSAAAATVRSVIGLRFPGGQKYEF